MSGLFERLPVKIAFVRANLIRIATHTAFHSVYFAGVGALFEVSIRIFQSSPSRITDQYPLSLYRAEVFAFDIGAPFSCCPYLIASRA